jgi:hypothetical protein
MTRQVDVFNGDADGICALHQLRLAEPAPQARLVTGVKRDVQLLSRLDDLRDADVLVLDVSLDSNREALLGLLQRGCRVRYFDHHFAGDMPQHPALEAHIDPSPQLCTSLLVDAHLGGAYRAWAVTAAYGDNMVAAAREAAAPLNLAPADLADLLDFFHEAPEAEVLREGFAGDLARAEGLAPLLDGPAGRVFRYPGEPWARRIMGVISNRMANDAPERATATVVDNPDGTLRISVRAPLTRPRGADELCRRYPSGGGRAGAAGVNALPPDALARFLDDFQAVFRP